MAEGDARVGLEILRRASKKAEDKGLGKVTIEEIKQAAKEAMRFKASFFLSKLNEPQRIIYEILGKKKRMASGELYREYCKLVKNPVVDRAYRNYMKKMVELGLVKVYDNIADFNFSTAFSSQFRYAIGGSFQNTFHASLSNFTMVF
jgi:Cdc6-like AAA superfamily ATPase